MPWIFCMWADNLSVYTSNWNKVYDQSEYPYHGDKAQKERDVWKYLE